MEQLASRIETQRPESRYSLEQVSDDDLLSNTRRLVGSSNELLAALLAHLAEVESRGIHRTRACASLYTYCVYELRMPEDTAFRRARAAKWVREFPILLDAIASGERRNNTPAGERPNAAQGKRRNRADNAPARQHTGQNSNHSAPARQHFGQNSNHSAPAR